MAFLFLKDKTHWLVWLSMSLRIEPQPLLCSLISCCSKTQLACKAKMDTSPCPRGSNHLPCLWPCPVPRWMPPLQLAPLRPGAIKIHFSWCFLWLSQCQGLSSCDTYHLIMGYSLLLYVCLIINEIISSWTTKTGACISVCPPLPPIPCTQLLFCVFNSVLLGARPNARPREYNSEKTEMVTASMDFDICWW